MRRIDVVFYTALTMFRTLLIRPIQVIRVLNLVAYWLGIGVGIAGEARTYWLDKVGIAPAGLDF